MSTDSPRGPTYRLKLRISTQEDATVVHCLGRLTADVSPEFKREIKSLIVQTKRLVLDLSDLTYLDSSGLGAVVALYVSAKSTNCEFRLINLSQQVRELLGMTKLLSVFEACGQYFTRMP